MQFLEAPFLNSFLVKKDLPFLVKLLGDQCSTRLVQFENPKIAKLPFSKVKMFLGGTVNILILTALYLILLEHCFQVYELQL